ncbi:MAG: hypothetical protein POELPBGB_00589 [Bacteroidia bacterium]|nr:hypothetical protein [Bacteroidia bacterium]
MPYENINATLSDADLLDICNLIDQSKLKLPFLINLTMKERKKYARQGAKIKAFNKKTLVYTQQNPQYIPNYMNINDAYADQELYDKLKTIKQRIDILSDGLQSTLLALQNEVYASTRVVYRSVENATKQNVPGSTEIYNDLKQHFPRTGKKKKKVIEE